MNVDEVGFIHQEAVTPGNDAEVNSLPDLLTGGETALYADAAYIGPRTRALLADRKITDRKITDHVQHRGARGHVQHRGARGHPLSPEGHARNVEIGVTRAGVERIFGHMKRCWGLRRTPYMGLAKTRTWFSLAALGWNLWKAASFQRLYG